MADLTDQIRPNRIVFLLLPEFSMMAFSAALEPLRAANRMYDGELYDWKLVSTDGEPVTASNGVTVSVGGMLDNSQPCDMLVVCAGLNTATHCNRELAAKLRPLARTTPIVGGVCTGSVALAKAGLLDGYRCTIHWEDLISFAENFPHLEITGRLYEVDRDRFTCSGGIAPLDLMIHLIGRDFGRELAAKVAEQMIHHMAREAHEPQRLSLIERTGVRHPKLLQALAIMEETIETPRSLDMIAAMAHLSARQMERLFQFHFARTPKRYYLDLRLARARHLLQHTALSIVQIALATGFSSAAHFNKAYRQAFNHTPRSERTGKSEPSGISKDPPSEELARNESEG
ncbi:GlxA family transcriptional regulator [Altererythrobacter sp.]|uniref:GlxA family transcriptional regulator n=1 Tax=Altererythrobacter sp. TaxID=1872480 RepID=UPI003CFC9364